MKLGAVLTSLTNCQLSALSLSFPRGWSLKRCTADLTQLSIAPQKAILAGALAERSLAFRVSSQ